MRIGLVHEEGFQNKKSWSGIPWFLGKALSNSDLEIEAFGPFPERQPFGYNWLRRYYHWAHSRWPLVHYEAKILRNYARRLETELQKRPVDVLVSIQERTIAYCHKDNLPPTIMIHDTTFDSIHGYYNSFSNIAERSVKLGNLAHQKAIDHSHHLIYASEWAATSAIQRYGKDSEQVSVIEFGANLDNPPSALEIDKAINKRNSGRQFHFLFLGVDWRRKGGDVAVNFISDLRKMGIEAILHVVGCELPPKHNYSEFIFGYGFLSKSSTKEHNQLVNLFKSAHFLLVPSTAECYGCVFCEANAFGIPVIANDTGGISQIVKKGINGFLFSENHKNYFGVLDDVISLTRDSHAYSTIAKSSRMEFEQRLNWKQFVKRLIPVIEKTVSCKSPL